MIKEATAGLLRFTLIFIISFLSMKSEVSVTGWEIHEKITGHQSTNLEMCTLN